ncbi:multidrug resistance-associated protein 1 isoform X2 [Hydra vulgaris]|uniref:multidrug resistance-associated protein 1 isoform X2 n=1 Tax=Hydra vulgaris TaxID=6087 RepID=UPI001F5E44C1|nr:multidrug resistance-associated protein 1-like isoform X2 [Hydra vulgaris]
MSERCRSIKKVYPYYFVALYNYDHHLYNKKNGPELKFNVYDNATHLYFKRGEILCMLSSVLDHWILCRSCITGEQGYVMASLLAPLSGAVDSIPSFHKGEKLPNTLRTSWLDPDFMKYFPNYPQSKPKKRCPIDDATFISRIFFGWVTSLIVKAYKKPLEDKDIWHLQKDNSATFLGKQFDKCWNKELEKYKKSADESDIEKQKTFRNPQFVSEDIAYKNISKCRKYRLSVLKVLLETCGKRYLIVAPMLQLLYLILLFVQPWLLGKSIEVIKNRQIDKCWGYFYASMLFLTGLMGSIILHQYLQIIFVTSLRARSSLLTAVYKKIFRISNTGNSQFTSGNMVNLMIVDTQKCYDLLTYLNLVWSCPLQIIIVFFYLYFLMGWSVLAGLCVLVLFIPLISFFSIYEKKLQAKQMMFKDSRCKIVNDIFAGIHTLKFNAWEGSFMARVLNFRNNELKLIKRAMLLQANHSFVLTLAPILVFVSTFTVYVLLGNELDAKRAFVAISLFSIIKFPLLSLPLVVSIIAQYNVSAKRLFNFLKSEELDPVSISDDISYENAIEIQNGTFRWNIHEEPILNNINLKIPVGSLTAIVGHVGSGKSSLVSAILGEIERVNGKVYVKSSISYVSQQPWIQNRSFRDNIVFVSDYENNLYDKIINACALKADIDLLPDGNQTEIGEKGINLSGGQKQRISIARAVYHNSDIYLMDDPLSAVDTHVGKHIFDQVIGNNGLLKNKTRLLVTHNLSYLPQVDQIIVIKDNTISEVGSYEELIMNGHAFSEFIKTYYCNVYNEEAVKDNQLKNNNIYHQEKVRVISKQASIEKLLNLKSFANSFASRRRVSLFEIMKNNRLIDAFYEFEKNEIYEKEASKILNRQEKLETLCNEKQTKDLCSKEVFKTGKIKWSVFLIYLRSIGIFMVILALFLGLITEGFSLCSRIWLADWSSNNNVSENKRNIYLEVFGGLGIAQGFFTWLEAYIIGFGVTKASKDLHDKLLKNVLRCPMLFFETTPVGRLINRFSKDINIIDESIPKSLKSLLPCFFTICSAVVTISYTVPLFIAPLLPIAVIYILIQRVYVTFSVQIRRIESVRRSPIYNHFFESINGVSTIRAYHLNDEFVSENESKIDFNQEANFQILCSNRWLELLLETCGNLITFCTAMICISQRERLTPGMVGLSISYALQAAVIIKSNQPDDDWPRFGAIDFHNLFIKYREDSDLVLNNISFKVEPSEKVGIVGRTGSGKSSIANALFRTIEACIGSIKVDNIDISTIGLNDLRSRMTIIPQNPVLFSGTIRFNIDPFDQHDDDDIWRVLEVSNLKPFVSSLENGIMHEIFDGGENLSVGQRQLLCLARALIRKSKVLVLDEATSSVDLETDGIIQEVIRKEFKLSTVLCIAHRLDTILDYDKIIVLNHGRIMEFNSPKVLFHQQGEFYKMVKEAGLSINTK